MAEKYDHKAIEKKWQTAWEAAGLYTHIDNTSKEKFYILDMFPYPSGDGLHMGHTESYTASDVVYRFKRMQGYDVLHPQGFDSFGLPAENYAIKTGTPPSQTTETNAQNYIRQMKSLGLGHDLNNLVYTSHPDYYKWTQYLFGKFFEGGLVTRKIDKINWCPSCNTGIANEQVEDGACERCKTEIQQKEIPGWFFKITDFSESLEKDLDDVDWPEATKKNQRAWIGKSEGAEIDFEIKDTNKFVTVFTTRPDTLFGVTYVVLAPEHPILNELKSRVANWGEVEDYIAFAKNRPELERKENKEKSGVKLGSVLAINPANNEEVPIFVADYVLGNYGTGAVMAVPAHDERDFEFAKKFGLDIKKVIEPVTGTKRDNEEFRRSIVALVEDPRTGKILSLNWGEMGGNLLIGGGLDDEENIVACAIREIGEETGYKHLEFVAQTEKIHHHYVAISKGVNREIEAVGLHFKLLDDERTEAALEENEVGKFIVEWLPSEKLVSLITDPLHKLIFERFVNNQIYTEAGILFASGKFDGLSNEDAKRKITDFVNGRWVTKYKLRDWSVSRQRYWGCPIPFVYSPEGEAKFVGEENLPWLLPTDVDFIPTGESPLAKSNELKERVEKIFGKGWTPEVDTMDTFVDSSWYFLRYPNVRNEKEFCSHEKLNRWLPVDLYIGGAEHTYMHLLYARFFVKALKKIGLVDFNEPFSKLRHQGMVLDKKGVKMSKSKGNVVNPDEMVERFGADAVRLYMLFAGPLDEAVMWNEDGVVGTFRFLEKAWKLQDKLSGDENSEIEKLLHKTIKKISDDIEELKFNTAISSMMIFVNVAEKEGVTKLQYQTFLKLLAPFAPHITEELWHALGNTELIHLASWPIFDASKCVESETTVAIQVNGKLRDTMVVPTGTSDDEIKRLGLELPNIIKWTEGKEIKKLIVVKGKLLSVVVGD